MHKQNWVPVGILAAALLLGGGMSLLRADQGKEKGCLDGMASVDMEKVYNASNAPEVMAAAAMKFEKQAVDQLREIAAVPYLSVAELQEYAPLVAKTMLTEPETARKKELRGLSDDRRKRVNELSVKQNLMPDEQKFLNEMAQRERNLQQSLPRIQADMQGSEAQQLQVMRREQMAKLHDMVEKVAKDKGFSHVFDSDSLIYSSNDLTAAVLQKLPKK